MAEGGWGSGSWGQAAWGSSVLTRVQADTAAATAIQTGGINRNVTVQERTNASATAQGLILRQTVVSEGVRASATVAAWRAKFRARTEAATAYADPYTQFNIRVSLAEGAQASAGLTYVTGLYAAVYEAVNASEMFGLRRYWEEVSDAQEPGWGPVTGFGAAAWGQVDDTQNPGWTPLSDNPIPTWQNTDDPQDPGWVEVNT